MKPRRVNDNYVMLLLVLLVTAAVVLPVIDASSFGLTDQDEGNYAAVAREMMRTGDYAIPHLMGAVWFNKPPLLYWLMVLSMRVLGPTELAVRMPSILAFWLTMAMLWVWGNARLGRGVGGRAALLFALSPLVMLIGRLAVTDMLLTCCLTAALIGMWETARDWRWGILWGVATGLAMLTKGPVGLGLIGIQFLISLPLLLSQGFRARRLIPALSVGLLVPLPWLALVIAQRGADFVSTFIVHENLLRFAGGDTAHAVKQPVPYLLYYAAILWAGLFPFSAFIPRALRSKADLLRSYIIRWCALVFIVFTLSITKLPAYVFPMFPAVALLIARSWPEPDGQADKSWVRWALIVSGGALWIGVTSALAVMTGSPLPALLGIGSTALGVLIGLHRHGTAYMAAAGLVAVVGLHFTLRAYDSVALDPVRSMVMSVPAGSTLLTYSLPEKRPSVFFYRDGRVEEPASAREVRAHMDDDTFCLTVAGLMPPDAFPAIREARIGSDSFVLLRGAAESRREP